MPVLGNRRTRRNRSSLYKRRKATTTPKITPAQRKFLNKLVTVLVEIIDERSQLSTKGGAVATGLEEEISGLTDVYHAEVDQSLLVKANEGTQPRPANHEAKNVVRFIKLCKDYEQLSNQVRSLLNALGGGGQMAKTLEAMSEATERIRDSFNSDEMIVDPQVCAESLEACSDAAYETWIAFKDLGIFNAHFSDTIAKMVTQLKTISAKLAAEYGRHSNCPIDQYLDLLFEPLVPVFSTFIDGLAGIADKEIAAIRQTQDFTSQRYLNLTTVATFLSSVTATTLQITADESDSPLVLITNTLWFISLVFSTASAVYSLLVMTWRQSSVCQPNLALPPSLYVWFRSGPMYALIAALISFSVGLCLLAFQKDIWISGVISTCFAGIHSCIIFVFAAYFVLELWKREITMACSTSRERYLNPLARSCSTVKDYIRRKCERLRKSWSSVRNLISRRPSLPPHAADIEKAKDIGLGFPTARVRSVTTHSTLAAPDDPVGELRPSLDSDQAKGVRSAPEVSGSEWSTVSSRVSSVAGNGLESNIEETSGREIIHRPTANLLEFSKNGKLLASACNEAVTIYNVEESFSILTTITTPDADEVKEMSWFPGTQRQQLLVTSRQSVSVWEIGMDSKHCVNETVSSVRWTIHEGVKAAGFTCVTGTTIRFFSNKLEEPRSIDIAKLYRTDHVVDAVCVSSKYLLCLVDAPETMEESCLLVINLKDGSIHKMIRVQYGHTSMTISLASKRILLHGGDGTEVVGLSISGSNEDFTIGVKRVTPLGFQIDDEHQAHWREGAVVFHGPRDRMLVGYSDSDVAVLYCEPGDNHLSALHIFTTPTSEVIPQGHVSFAVNSGSLPYMFAFSGEDGRVTIWTVQSNRLLDECRSARKFEVHDRCGGRWQNPIVTVGKCLILPSSSAESD